MKSLEPEFKTIYETHYPKVIRLCMGYSSGNEALAKDLAQDVFIRVWENLGSFRKESALSTWIYRITVNTCLIQIRKQKKTRFVSEDFVQISMGDETSSKEKEKHFKKLYACIDKLNKTNKAIILLELENVPQNEIAEVIGISHQALRTRINRIKKKLTNCVKK